MRPYAGNYQYTPDPQRYLTDKELLRLICAFRMLFPQVGIVLSTREPGPLRDSLAPLGVTHMSAGARTEPGGYTGAGNDDLHHTIRGRRVERQNPSTCDKATEQFRISDTRSAAEIAKALCENHLDPVWKDWEEVLLSNH